MRCKCGYHFSREALDCARKDLPTEYRQFAVIEDKYYPIFIRREVEVLKSCDELQRLHLLAESSQYCGCMMVCPRCSRLLLLRSDQDEVEFFVKDE